MCLCVAQACQVALRKVAALAGEDVAKVVTDRGENIDPSGFDEFAVTVAALLVKRHPDRLRGYLDAAVHYFGSKWDVLRANAATFTGTYTSSQSLCCFPRLRDRVSTLVDSLGAVLGALCAGTLLASATPEDRKKVNPNAICTGAPMLILA